MGHLMLSTMKKIQAALAKLTLDKDGVDGKGLYIYGEAWDFGEVRSPTHLLLETCFSGCDLLYCAKVLLSQSVSACLPACPHASASLPTYLSLSKALSASRLFESMSTEPAHPMCVWWQVSSNQRGVNASQLNIGGTGLGSFNDRFRDAVVGGSPFASPLFQGWVTGQLLTPPTASIIKCS